MCVCKLMKNKRSVILLLINNFQIFFVQGKQYRSDPDMYKTVSSYFLIYGYIIKYMNYYSDTYSKRRFIFRHRFGKNPY